MPRPISWLPFVRELHRSVSGSVRSHYESSQIQALFKLQPRSAQMLIELMPRQPIGNSFLIKKEDLTVLLERVREAKDAGGNKAVRELFEKIRTEEKPGIVRQKVRGLVRRDHEPAVVASLPERISLRRGHVSIDFRNQVELAEAMMWIAKVIESDEFEDAYCVPLPRERMSPRTIGEGQAILDELREIQSASAPPQTS